MMKALKGVLSLIIGFTMNAVTLGASPSGVSQSVVDKVEAQYSKTKDLQADFTQETLFDGFETGFSSSGKLYLKKPGLLRWDYLEPSKEQIYVDGDQVLMYVPDHQQVVKGTLTQLAASKGPLALLQDAGTLSQHFSVVDASSEDRGNKKIPVLTLVPKSTGEKPPTLKKIVLKLSPDSFLIQEITLFEASGNVSRVAFDHIQVNQGVSARLLQFEVPSDVVVVEMPALR